MGDGEKKHSADKLVERKWMSFSTCSSLTATSAHGTAKLAATWRRCVGRWRSLTRAFIVEKIVKAIHELMEEEGAVQLLQTKLDEAVERETDGGCSGTTVEAMSSGAIASAVHAVMESSLMQRVVEKTRRVVSVPNPPQSIDASLSLQDEEHRVATQPQESQLQPKRRVSSGAGEPLQWEALEPGTEVLVLDDGESQGSDQRFDVRAALWRIAGASEPDENRDSRGERKARFFANTESMSSSGSTEPTPSNSRTPPAAGAASRVSPEELFVALGKLSMADVLSFEHWKRIVNVLVAQLTSARHNDALTYLARMFSSASGEQSVFMYNGRSGARSPATQRGIGHSVGSHPPAVSARRTAKSLGCF